MTRSPFVVMALTVLVSASCSSPTTPSNPIGPPVAVTLQPMTYHRTEVTYPYHADTRVLAWGGNINPDDLPLRRGFRCNMSTWDPITERISCLSIDQQVYVGQPICTWVVDPARIVIEYPSSGQVGSDIFRSDGSKMEPTPGPLGSERACGTIQADGMIR